MRHSSRTCLPLRLLIIIISILFAFPAAASEPPTHWYRVADEFLVQPTTVQVVGQAGIYPVSGVVMLDPIPGRTMDVFPISQGATQASIPAHTIYIFPFVPRSMGSFSVHGVLPVSAAWFKVPFPAMVVDLPHPVPEGSDTMTVQLPEVLKMKTTILPFTLPIVSPLGGAGTVHNDIHGTSDLPLFPVITLTLEIKGKDPVYHYGVLGYDLTTETRASSTSPWSWQIGGWWEVEIWDYHKRPDIARLTHHRRYNNVGGVLESVSEPALPDLGELAVTETGSANRPQYKIQFAKMKGGGSHTLIFVNDRPQGPPKMEQPFPSVAMIALGQWMRKMGGPDLKVDAPLVPQDEPTTWTVNVDNEREMTLHWCME